MAWIINDIRMLSPEHPKPLKKITQSVTKRGKAMCVLLDVRFRTYSGPANAIVNLVPKLCKLAKDRYILICYRDQEEYFPDSQFNKIVAPDNLIFDLVWTQFVLPILILKNGFHLYISFKYLFGPIFPKINKIYFVRAILGNFRGNTYPVSLKIKIFWCVIGVFCLRRASKLVAVSRFVKEYLVEELHISENKISIIHNGFDIGDSLKDDGSDSGKLLELGISRPFLLCCGNVLPVKNHETAVEMMKHLPMRFADYQLVIAGDHSSPHAIWLREQVNKSPLRARVIFTGFLDRKRLAVLYRQASVFVLPSLTEAFSIVILEALAFGLPVVASDRGALKEVCGDSALYVDDPKDSIGFARCVDQVLTISQEMEFAEKAKQRSSVFGWDSIARQCHELFFNESDKLSKASPGE